MAHPVMENIPEKPRYSFTPASPFVSRIIENGKLVEKRYYLHPKLGDSYRYKYTWDGSVWWIDVPLDGESLQVWKLDGSCWFEGKAAAAGDSDDDE